MNGKQTIMLVGVVGFVLYLISSGHHEAPAAVPPASTYNPPIATYVEPTPPAPAPTTYTVQNGDGWGRIAIVNGVTLGALLAANNAPSTDVPLYPGQVLQLPSGTQPRTTVATAATTPRRVAPTPTTPPTALTYAQPPMYQPPPTYQPAPTYPAPAPGYGAISPQTGLPRTNYVHGYTRKDGTYVQPYYRSHK